MTKKSKIKNDLASLPNLGKIREELVEAFKKEKEDRGLKYNQLMGEILEKRYCIDTPEGRKTSYLKGKEMLKDIVKKYESTNNQSLKITELKRLRSTTRRIRDTDWIFFQHRQLDGKNLPDFIKYILDEHPLEEILYETLKLIQEIFPKVKNDVKERELWCTDIFPYLKIILENEKTKTKILEEAIKGLCAMKDEYENLIKIEYGYRKRNIDVLGYLLELQKRCYSWPEYKPFLESNAQGWVDLYVKNLFQKDLTGLREYIFANMDEVPDELREAYISMKERIDRRLDYLLEKSKYIKEGHLPS